MRRRRFTSIGFFNKSRCTPSRLPPRLFFSSGLPRLSGMNLDSNVYFNGLLFLVFSIACRRAPCVCSTWEPTVHPVASGYTA